MQQQSGVAIKVAHDRVTLRYKVRYAAGQRACAAVVIGLQMHTHERTPSTDCLPHGRRRG